MKKWTFQQYSRFIKCAVFVCYQHNSNCAARIWMISGTWLVYDPSWPKDKLNNLWFLSGSIFKPGHSSKTNGWIFMKSFFCRDPGQIWIKFVEWVRFGSRNTFHYLVPISVQFQNLSWFWSPCSLKEGHNSNSKQTLLYLASNSTRLPGETLKMYIRFKISWLINKMKFKHF